jgi:drug/metabolite transporter (DMT)-like permease
MKIYRSVYSRRALVDVGLSALFVLCWASGFIGAKLGAADAPVATVMMWRFLPLALVLVPIAWRTSRRHHLTVVTLRRHALIGLLSQSGYLLTVYTAIGLGVNTGTTALIDGVQPLVAAALVGPLLAQKVTGRQWAGLVVGLAGVAVVTLADATANADVPWWAYLVASAGMLSLVAATFVERRSPTRVPAVEGLAIHCTASAGVFTVLALLGGTASAPAEPRFWLAIAWLIVLSTIGGYGLYWVLLARIGITRLNTLMFLMAPVTTLWGTLMFGEPFNGVTAVGLALGVAAVAIVSATRTGSQRIAGGAGACGRPTALQMGLGADESRRPRVTRGSD